MQKEYIFKRPLVMIHFQRQECVSHLVIMQEEDIQLDTDILCHNFNFIWHSVNQEDVNSDFMMLVCKKK